MNGCANLPEEYEELNEQSFDLSLPKKKINNVSYVNSNNPLLKETQKANKKRVEFRDTAFWQREASVHFEDLPLSIALKGLSESFEFDFSIDFAIHEKINFQGNNIPLAHIIASLERQSGVQVKWYSKKVLFQKNVASWRAHDVPYLNIRRKSISRLALKQSINQDGSNSGDITQIDNAVENSFWGNLKNNLEFFLEENDRLVVNHEAGVISVHATQSTQEIIDKYLNKVMKSHSRQVIIEVSILEVELNNEYQQGIDWSVISGNNSVSQSLLGAALVQSPNGQILTSLVSDDLTANVNIRLLEQFGSTKVLSSPRLQVLNNQTALLKVVDNLVYFTVDSATSINQNGSVTNFDTEINSVAVGLILALTPFINNQDEILLNLRPTISRIAGTVRDPHPVLAQQGVISEVPIIQKRELESILKVRSGSTAVIGGLIQQRAVHSNSSLPNLSGLGLDGSSKRNSELVLLIKPKIIQ